MFQAIDAERFTLTDQNPVRLLQEASAGALRRAAADDGLLERIVAAEAQVKADLERPPYPSIDPARPVAFLCAEYGVHVSLPVYSGGLGALAGDLLKEASDCAVPFVAVGLMYRKGYFRQRIDAGGWQHEYWIDTDPQRLPAALVTGPGEQPLTIELPIYDSERHGADLARRRGPRPAVPARHRHPRERAGRPLDHRSPVRGRRADRAWPSTSCSAPAECGL